MLNTALLFLNAFIHEYQEQAHLGNNREENTGI